MIVHDRPVLLGQDSVSTSVTEKFFSEIEKRAVMLVVIGAVIGIIGTVPLEGSLFGPIVSSVGGFIAAAGLVPIIVRAI